MLAYEAAPVPTPLEGEVLVEVRAAAITFTELTWEETWSRNGHPRTPIIPSHEMSGTVRQLGRGVTAFSVGDEVIGLVPFDRDGAAAELVTLPAINLAPKPAGVSWAQAAVIPLAALTAWQAIVEQGGVGKGSRVLIQGAAGGVGLLALQLATVFGAIVTGTGSASDAPLMKAHGAVQTLDYATQPLSAAGGDFDIVLYAVPGTPPEASYAVLRPGGRLICLNAPPDDELAQKYAIDARFFIVTPNPQQMAAVAQMVQDGRIAVNVAGIFPLADGRQAYESGSSRDRVSGKVVLAVKGAVA